MAVVGAVLIFSHYKLIVSVEDDYIRELSFHHEERIVWSIGEAVYQITALLHSAMNGVIKHKEW